MKKINIVKKIFKKWKNLKKVFDEVTLNISDKKTIVQFGKKIKKFVKDYLF